MSPSVAIISAIIGLVTLVFAIFGASWLNQRATERFLEQLERRLESKFDARIDLLQTEFRSESRRLDQRLDSVENRLESMEKHFDQRLERIERQLEAIFKPDLPPPQRSSS